MSRETPELDGQPYITCNDDSTVDRWDGNAVLILPTKSETRLAAFGGITGGKIGKLGGFVDNLGTKVPLASGVYLNRVGVGICVNPPPLKLRGDAGVSVFPTPKTETLGINGYMIFTSGTKTTPWSLELGGSVEVFDKLIGSGAVTIRATGALDFRVATSLSLLGVVSVNGQLQGWVETKTKKFNIEGSGRACLTALCADADAIASSSGIGGCATVVRIPFWVLRRDSNWKWYKPWRVHWERSDIIVRSGFGHRGSGSVQMLGNSCNFGPYRATRTAGTSQAGGKSFRISSGTPVISVLARGQGGAPRISLRGPGGERVELPAGQPAVQQADGTRMIQNTSDDSTSVLLIKPSAGTWTITPEAGSVPVTEVLTSGYEPDAAVSANVHRVASGALRIGTSYTVPEGSTLSLVEQGKDVQRTLVARVRGRDCPAPKSPDGRSPQCATADFTPAPGPGGTRRIVAVVSRDGLPLSQTVVARFRAPRQQLPARPRGLRMQRYAASVVIRWDRSPGVGQHSLSTVLASGQMQGHMLASSCRALSLPVTRGTAVRVSLAGVRYDLETGRRSVRVLKGSARRSGSSQLPPSLARNGKVCR